MVLKGKKILLLSSAQNEDSFTGFSKGTSPTDHPSKDITNNARINSVENAVERLILFGKRELVN